MDYDKRRQYQYEETRREELSDVTAQCLNVRPNGTLAFDIVDQSNHGVCAAAMDPWAAFERIERLDHICEIVLKSGVGVREVVCQAVSA